jgi:hypothetical protein
MGTLYELSGTPNAEVRLRFYALALSPPTSEAAAHFVAEAAKWVVGEDGTGVIKGRMKFCRPLFKAVHKVDSKLATGLWAAHKNNFHPIARRLIEKVSLGLPCVTQRSCYAIGLGDCMNSCRVFIVSLLKHVFQWRGRATNQNNRSRPHRVILTASNLFFLS